MITGSPRSPRSPRRPAADDYTPSSILVTGGAGFIGSAVARRLARRYPHYRVVVLDRLDYCASLRNLDAVAQLPNFKFVRGDVQSGDLMAYVLATEKIDTVLHFAAQTHVDNSFGNSLAFTLTNTYGTHVLLEACRVVGGVRRFVNVSTDEVYGEASVGLDDGVDEETVLEPTNPYSAAKAGAEMIARAYHTSYKLPVITTRGNNVYGPGQFPEKLVPKFTLLAARGRPLPVHGSGAATRSYLYVDDVAAAFDVILHRGVVGETYNIGSQKERTVLDVARDVSAIFGAAAPPVAHVRDRAFNDRRYYVSDAKLAALGWAETTAWADGLRATVDWYLQHAPAPADGRDAPAAASPPSPASSSASASAAPWWDPADVEAALAPHPTLHNAARCSGALAPPGGAGGLAAAVVGAAAPMAVSQPATPPDA